ncbi:retrovirus-related pol polyprotein from transposon TNT 1-94 [Tanacetum coccineum]
MDLCGPMRIASINGKRYVLVIVDDYSRYTWVHFLRSKDKAPEVIKTFLKRITVLLQSPVIIIRTDNDTEFKNQILKEYFDSVGISHQASSVRTPQQNGVVERRNRTLVEAARTIVYNRRTKKIMETMNVTFDELLTMVFELSSLKPELQSMTSGLHQISKLSLNKCEECKYDKISYDKAYHDMQRKIERLQAQLGDHKGKSKDTLCVSDTIDPLSQKLKNENMELEFQVLNYAKENAHLKTTYKNLFDSIKVTQAQTKAIIDSLQDKLHDLIYENAKLRAWLFDKVSEQRDTNKGMSVGKSNALSKPVTSNSAPSSRESTVVNNERVIAPGIFRINPFKASREDVNSSRNGFSPNNVKSTTRTRRPQPRNNPKNDKYVNGMKSRTKNQSANVSKSANQKKQKANVKKSKSLSSEDRLDSSRPSKPRTCLKWLPTGRIFDLYRKITSSSNTKSESDTSVCDNASVSNPSNLQTKGFQVLLLFLAGF